MAALGGGVSEKSPEPHQPILSHDRHPAHRGLHSDVVSDRCFPLNMAIGGWSVCLGLGATVYWSHRGAQATRVSPGLEFFICGAALVVSEISTPPVLEAPSHSRALPPDAQCGALVVITH